MLRRTISISLCILLFAVLLLPGCFRKLPIKPTLPSVTTAPITDPSIEPTTVPSTEPPTVPSTEPPTDPLPEHSDLYIPGVSVEDVILYFNEVCLDAEFVNNGNPNVLQKWGEPITYIIYGEYTAEDLATLKGFMDWLNTIEGFPGIQETTVSALSDMDIHFCTQSELLNILGDNFYGNDGGVTFWYNNDIIYDAIICYRTDLDQTVRNSVILEEIYNGLGPVQDTDLRKDSIIFSGYSAPQELTEIDELIIKLLYHPDMRCGMNADACEAVIRQLYY